MKVIFIYLVFLLLLACNNEPTVPSNAKQVSKENNLAVTHNKSLQQVFEEKVTDTLFKLSFIQKSHLLIDSITNHKHGIAFIADSVVDNKKDVFVKAGYNSEYRFETYYQFYINPVTMQIKVYDVAEDAQIQLSEYIKKTEQE